MSKSRQAAAGGPRPAEAHQASSRGSIASVQFLNRPATADDGDPGTPYLLPSIPYLRLRCTLVAREPAQLPAYHGSLLRGAFGHALRRAVCAMGPEQPCATCRLRRTCVHTQLFETFIEEEDPPPFLRGLPSPPRPYLFEPRSDRRDFAPGDPLDFDLLLVGRAADLAAYALLAVERMAAAGLGSRRSRFALDGVLSPAAAGGDWQPLVEKAEVVPGAVPLPQWTEAPADAAERATLRFLTPTRLKVRGHLADGVGFRTLAFTMLRRTLELAHFYVPGVAIDWDLAPLLERAQAVRIATSDLHWHDWERYSQRQGSTMTLGGFVGSLTLEGELAPFAALLRAAEVLHVGKGATFGLGRVEVAFG